MSEPYSILQPVHTVEQTGVWTQRLILFLRIMASPSLLKGLYHWAVVCGIGDGADGTFESGPPPWQAATVFFAVIDLVAAVGLWLAAAWGGVVWLTACILMAAVEMFFPQIYGGRLWVVVLEMVLIASYLWLTVLSGRERY